MSKNKKASPLAVPEHVALKDLLLDVANPRFGRQAGEFRHQSQVVDYIVSTFGVDSLLSSLALNGYFEAEPVVVRPAEGGKYVVAEGNRRLAACLILAGDERAEKHKARRRKWLPHAKHEWTGQTVIPVRVFAGAEAAAELLPYLGVRHLVASQPWDSYAKAKWVASVVEGGEMTLGQISLVTGDENNTIEKLLEGYYFVNNLIDRRLFDPKSSMRRGRGSNPDFPFSWVYTLLGYPGVRQWLRLRDGEPARVVVSEDNEEAACQALVFLFGDKNRSRAPAITDSRQIGLLAAALKDPTRRALLESGKTAQQVDVLSKPVPDQVAKSLADAELALGAASQALSGGEVPPEHLDSLLAQATKVRAMANDVQTRLSQRKQGADHA